ncbi:ribonuclease H-like YkuK family protein [Schnuerera sp. xch1]|uniref:ribonuclease H-like YkuK family protein n=1 Tax=Schnuerera sp. xch1 TaxID=2874283 RepID=UPI001CBE8960|nr:ribonuclease H-like YkuK family protein [Schnuerera sp. xch1]MBZ2174551.1 ribonuclease H-like YkuK family protein [Schnuerera sp. xch1]
MRSPTYGEISYKKMIDIIKDFINKAPHSTYNISVGTDSQNFDGTKTVVVVAVHRIGNGGIFFYDIKTVKRITNISQKLFYETSNSLNLAIKLSETLERESIDFGISIHVDAGKKGKTSKLIPEIVGWIKACGFTCETKPNSYAASSIADKYSK